MATYINRRGPNPTVVMAADGVVEIPTYNRTVIFTKGGAVAATLAAPESAHDGVRLTFCNGAAQANTITNASPGFNNAGGSFDVATSAGAIGDCFAVEAYGGAWYVVSASGYSLT